MGAPNPGPGPFANYLRGGVARLRGFLPFGLEAAIVAGLLFTLSALAGTLIVEEQVSRRTLIVAGINGTGATIGFLLAWIVWTFLVPRRGRWLGLAFAVFSAAIGCGMAFALHLVAYSAYYSEWHAPPLSIIWGYQMVYTTAAALAIYLTRGLIYLLPLCWLAPLFAVWRLHRAWNEAARR